MTKQLLQLLLLLPLVAVASGEKQMSPLDLAYIAMQQDIQKQSGFYHLFMNSELFIPVHSIPEIEQKQTRASEDKSIAPILIESDGTKYLMIFDSRVSNEIIKTVKPFYISGE